MSNHGCEDRRSVSDLAQRSSIVMLFDRAGSCSIESVSAALNHLDRQNCRRALTGSLLTVCFGARVADVLVELLGGLLCDADALGMVPVKQNMLIVESVSSSAFGR